MRYCELKIPTCAFILLLGAHSLPAQDTPVNAEQLKPPRVAHEEPPTDDPDYSLMGEFVGVVAKGEDQFEPLGLQLSPKSPGEFQALQFIGGLPGHEGFQASRIIPLIGRRFENVLILSGGPWAIWVHHDHCVIIDGQGKNLGRLERIQRGSTTMGARPPEGAIVLFDGTSTDQFTTARMTDNGLLMAGADVRPMFQDFHLHCEFRLPYMPNSDDQARGNSGCYLLSRYEVQILDSFAQLPRFNGAAAIYRTKAPDVNMSFPPLVWQTYDITFTAPRWAADGTKTRNARITVWHNGVIVQDNVEIPNKTGAGREEEPTLLPIRFQNHGDPVVFRNIWLIDRGLTEGIPFPVLSPTPEQLEAERREAEELAAQEKAAQEKVAQENSQPASNNQESVEEPNPPAATPAPPSDTPPPPPDTPVSPANEDSPTSNVEQPPAESSRTNNQ